MLLHLQPIFRNHICEEGEQDMVNLSSTAESEWNGSCQKRVVNTDYAYYYYHT